MTAANTPNFNPEKYTNIASNHLAVYSVYFLYKDGDEIRAEDIISACFTLFPKKFSLRTYPQWPDSALVGRRLHDCEKNGWITARIDTGFKLTAKGTRLAEEVAEKLGAEVRKKEKPRRSGKPRVGRLQAGKLQAVETAKPALVTKPAPVKPKPEEKTKAPAAKPAPVKPKPEEKTKAPAAKPVHIKPKDEKPQVAETEKPGVQRSRVKVQPAPSAEEKAKAGKFIKMMEASDAYRLYKKNGANSKIGEFDFRSLLLCTMESSHETLARNMELFKGYAEIHNRKDLVVFLAACREKFAYLLAPEKKAARKIR